MKKPKYDFSKENPYNTFGKTEFLNANTGEIVRTVTEDYRLASQKGTIFTYTGGNKSSLLRYFPESIDLSGIILEGVENRVYTKEEIEKFPDGKLKVIYKYLHKKGLLKDLLDLAETEEEIKLGILKRLPFAVFIDSSVPNADSLLPFISDINLPILHIKDLQTTDLSNISIETLKFLLDRESSL